jgi:hypothetical protein
LTRVLGHKSAELTLSHINLGKRLRVRPVRENARQKFATAYHKGRKTLSSRLNLEIDRKSSQL